MEGSATDEEYLYNVLAQNITSQGEPHFSRWLSLLKLNITSQGGHMTKVTYGWTVTILSYLQVDAWPKLLTGGR